MHYLYIIYSTKINRYYVGETNDMNRRLQEHLEGVFSGSYTTRAKDWELKLTISFKDITSARKAEAFIKRMNSSIFIKKLISDHQWFINKFNS